MALHLLAAVLMNIEVYASTKSFELRSRRYHVDRTTHRVASKQRSLRTAQYLYTLKIEKFTILRSRSPHWDIINVHFYTRVRSG